MTDSISAPLPAALRYEEFEPRVRTGDVLLCHGSSAISETIEVITGSKYSHVAMVVRPDPTKPPMVWQAGPGPIVEDPRTLTMHTGAQLGDLVTVLPVLCNPKYGDVTYWRPLTVDRGADFETLALQAVADLDGRPFPTMTQMFEEWVIGKLHITASDRTFFCGQLVAETFMRMGLLPPEPPPNAYQPGLFSDQFRRLQLQKGATFGVSQQILAPQVTPAT